MVLILTRKGDGLKIGVDPTEVKLWEPDSDGVSTHVVFGPDLVRVVTESFDDIMKTLGETVFSGN